MQSTRSIKTFDHIGLWNGLVFVPTPNQKEWEVNAHELARGFNVGVNMVLMGCSVIHAAFKRCK
jgi:hypothetical protein